MYRLRRMSIAAVYRKKFKDTFKGSISLVLHSAPIDSQVRQFITGYCILMGSYFARTAGQSMVMTINSATVRSNPRVISLSSGIVLTQIISAKIMKSLFPRNRNSSPLSLPQILLTTKGNPCHEEEGSQWSRRHDG